MLSHVAVLHIIQSLEAIPTSQHSNPGGLSHVLVLQGSYQLKAGATCSRSRSKIVRWLLLRHDSRVFPDLEACLLFLTLYFLALPFSRPKSAALSQLDLIMLIRSQSNLFFLPFLQNCFLLPVPILKGLGFSRSLVLYKAVAVEVPIRSSQSGSKRSLFLSAIGAIGISQTILGINWYNYYILLHSYEVYLLKIFRIFFWWVFWKTIGFHQELCGTIVL